MRIETVQKRRIITALVAVIFLVAPGHWTSALSLEPLSQVFDTSVSGRIRTFRVTNTQNDRIAVRIRITTRDILPTGEEVREPADDRWLVFPQQLTLQPGANQAVRVQYTGPGGIETEEAFRIIAEQLPVDFSDGAPGTSGINMLFRYEGAVYVQPPRAEPNILLTESSRQFEEGEFRGVLLRFENRGTAHGILRGLTVRLRRLNAEGDVLNELELAGDDLPVTAGTNLLAGRILEEYLELPPAWADGTLDVEYEAEIIQ